MKNDPQHETDSESAHGGSYVCSFRFALSILCFLLTMNLYAQRTGMSVAIVCMVNHTAVALMRDAHSQSSNDITGGNLTTTPPGEWQKNVSEDDASNRSPCVGNLVAGSNRSVAMDGPFVWPKEIQGHILGAFYYGYMVSQIPSGLMAERLGAKWVLFGFLSVSTLATLLTPIVAKLGYEAVIIARIAAGIGSGAMYPGLSAMWGQWAPPMERSRLALVSYTGGMIGSVIAMPLSGLLCNRGFDEGWSSIFYTYGISSTVVLIMWAVVASNTPATNRFASKKEKLYIMKSLAVESSKQSLSMKEMPWRRFVTSGPVWAIVIANFCMDWGGYTLMTNIPTFYKEVLLFDIESNGLYSALPFVGVWISSVVSPVIADHLRSRKFLSTTTTRKLFTFVGAFGGALFLIGVSFLNCTQTALAVTLMTLSTTMSGVSLCGFFVNHMDIAPQFSGTLMGVSNGIAAASGFIAPLVAAVLTTDQTRESWQVVFFISAGIFMLGGVVYCVLGSGVIQPWACEHLQPTNDISLIPKPVRAPTPPADSKSVLPKE